VNPPRRACSAFSAESHKDQMLDEIIKVAEKLAPETISLFETAKTENQFLKAIESVEDALPVPSLGW
jgi:hypothetical protein